MSKSASLNCIDLSDPDIQKSVHLVKQACKDSGFFYVINHGISQELIDEVFAQSKKFFDLPLEEKMKVLSTEKHRGYTPMFDEALDPQKQISGDYKEGYYIGVEVREDDPRSQKTFFGPNPWPSPGMMLPYFVTVTFNPREQVYVYGFLGYPLLCHFYSK